MALFRCGAVPAIELLWTNPNPSVDFASDISIDLSSYNEIIIDVTDVNPQGTVNATLFGNAFHVQAGSSTFLLVQENGVGGVDRPFSFKADLSQGLSFAAHTRDNVIPLKIYGVKQSL